MRHEGNGRVEADSEGKKRTRTVTQRDPAVVGASLGGCGTVYWLHTQVQSDRWATRASLAFGTWSGSICMEVAMKSYGSV